MIEYGTGQGRTRHIIRRVSLANVSYVKGVCGAYINMNIPSEIMIRKPLCKACARLRHVTPCSHCGGTGMEPSGGAT